MTTDGGRGGDGTTPDDPLLRLPQSLRAAFKEPLGPVYTDADALLADAAEPILAVGDVVTAHLRRAGHTPHLALVDGKTEREAVSEATAAALSDETARVPVTNPAGTLTRELLVAVRDAVAGTASTVLHVEGEEDLATLPALVVAPDGASVVYGQPGEGMVLVATDEARDRARDLLGRMDGDTETALALLTDE
ncbi:GTP-dependent dephospho-CoA kinase family protein [Halobaculum sp. MBLA0147]|uniref:GTP-dependent dephospho-CoA kinase family protein n=1 Tax=Halobaculum sp. MBLA0147 TaxID=3079934 RepID=UPI00352559EB